ncbi:MAG: hypothetical protein R2824_20585 [Saprospiraceae bacterium]|nr:hypothetical protein [Lewinella sp.]
MHKFSFWDYDMAGRSRSRLAFFLLPVCLFTACRNASSPLEPSSEFTDFQGFYHWTTDLVLDSTEQSWLDQLSIDRLYVKFFDLDWDPAESEVVPLAFVQLDTSGIARRQVIPTVFITNRSMLQSQEADIPLLAHRIKEKIEVQFAPLDQSLVEVQMDCDWTPSSRERYFQLLKELHTLYSTQGVALSSTIRLHQFRYPDQTGVPPVDRGVLMFYNMGDLQDWEESNSILNLEKAAAYLPSGLDYPLHLDLALPLFRWAVLFREGQMIKLINEPNELSILESGKYLELAPNRYKVMEGTYLDGYYLYPGDLLRIESVSPRQLKDAVELVRSKYPEIAANLIWYHLDGAVLKRYRIEAFAGL